MDRTEVLELDNITNEILKKSFSGHREGFCRFGEEGYIMPKNYMAHVDALKFMEVRQDDVWILGYPRSGTTMTQEMVWLLRNNMDFESALSIPLGERYHFIEFFTMIQEQLSKLQRNERNINIDAFEDIGYKSAEKAKSPRHIKTHLPLSLLPSNLLDKAKVIYLARDPRDVAVSYFHQNKLFKFQGFVGDFKSYWQLFVEDLIPWTPFFSHVKEAWAHRQHPNIFFIFYEDISKNLHETLRLISKFLGKQYSEAQVQKLCDHLDFKKFKNNQSVHPSWMQNSSLVNTGAELFIRRGKTGGWRDYFDEEMNDQAEKWIQRNLEDTDLRFPTV